MSIDKIREQLAEKIRYDLSWAERLETEPEGQIIDWDVEIDVENLWVDVPSKTFRFRGVGFSFELLLGSSNPKDGVQFNFSRTATGSGKFEFVLGRNNVELIDLDIKVDNLDLFATA